jgi:uncharacterized protein (TIGR03435 family)
VATDVHASPQGYPNFQTVPAHDGRYELKKASMLDLIRTAYGFDLDKILGGPNWIELDRFDIAGKLPGETSPDDQKLMLQGLLEDRFKLIARKDTKPIPGYALIAGKKPAIKEASGDKKAGCEPQRSSGAAEGGMGMIGMVVNGNVVTISMGANMTVTYNCRNVTMEAFAQNLRTMISTSLNTTPLVEDSGLKGAWDFDLTYSVSSTAPDRITIFDAVEKLGLKLEPRQISTPVLSVESVNRTPTPNAPDLAKVMPSLLPVTEFDVASVKPSEPGTPGNGYQVQPGGRVNFRGVPMSQLLYYCFNDWNSPLHPQINGTPKWADSARFDIIAKAPPDTAPLDSRNIAPPLIALLKDRFKMAYHVEQQPGPAFSLQAAKPKLKVADAANRSSCKRSAAPAGSPGGSLLVTCKNMTMAQFADFLSYSSMGINGPVSDDTGLNGVWDLTLNFNYGTSMARSTEGPAGEAPVAAEPAAGYTLFEAIEKQLGLKLESVKKPQPVYIIEHLEQKPTEDQ